MFVTVEHIQFITKNGNPMLDSLQFAVQVLWSG